MVALYSGQYTYQHFGVVKCYTSTNSIVIFNYLVKSCYYLYNNRIGSYLCNIFRRFQYHQKCWYWPDTDTDTRIGAALIAIASYTHVTNVIIGNGHISNGMLIILVTNLIKLVTCIWLWPC